MSKPFIVAVEAATADEEPNDYDEPRTFTFADDPDTELTVFLPTEGQITAIMALQVAESGPDQVAKAQQIMLSLFDERTQKYIERRMLSRTSPLSLRSVFNVFMKLTEQEAGRPTESSADSLPSRPATGKPSTVKPRRAASTRSRSASTGSATTSTGGSSRTTRSKGKNSTGS